jgi:hypothetical protein
MINGSRFDSIFRQQINRPVLDQNGSSIFEEDCADSTNLPGIAVFCSLKTSPRVALVLNKFTVVKKVVSARPSLSVLLLHVLQRSSSSNGAGAGAGLFVCVCF